ncbi:hypothetical protein KPYH43_c0814 [Klebsiella pneumoniae]|nr:hypothetical protein KPYH43_c0814 [Klebsiella pneumoniae]
MAQQDVTELNKFAEGKVKYGRKSRVQQSAAHKKSLPQEAMVSEVLLSARQARSTASATP